MALTVIEFSEAQRAERDGLDEECGRLHRESRTAREKYEEFTQRLEEKHGSLEGLDVRIEGNYILIRDRQ